jgi:hypothetical protein
MPQVREVSQWPADAAVWLYKAGLGRDEIGRLGIYYHPPSDRVVLPVYSAGVPVFYQARAYQKGRMPKYLGPTPRPPTLHPRWGLSSFVPTLTEDILSAMKIGLVAQGWAVLGTRVSDHMVAELMKVGRCYTWLDPDAAGRRGAAKIVKQLRAYGLEVRDIVSERDPKLHTRDQIKEYLHVS